MPEPERSMDLNAPDAQRHHASAAGARNRPAQKKQDSVMHSLGAFFGHIAQGIKSNPADATPPPSSTPTVSHSPHDPHATSSDSDRREISRKVQETEQVREDGERVILRRTVIEEVEVRRADAGNT